MADFSSRRLTILVAVFGLMGSLIGAAAGYFGVRETLDNQLEQQATSMREERAADTRDRRESIYSTYLDAANRFAFATDAFLDGCTVDRSKCQVSGDAHSEYLEARRAHQSAINMIYIYGSARAVEGMKSVARTLPPSVASLDDMFEVKQIGPEFFAAFNAFLSVMCQELPPTPRKEC